MRPLMAADLLELWEQGINRPPLTQALLLLGFVFPQASRHALANLTVAQRDLVLFHLRAVTFGSQVQATALCPACGEKLEMDVALSDFGLPNLPLDANWPFETAAGSNAEKLLQIDPYRVVFRSPTSADLANIPIQTIGLETARQQLFAACILSIQQNDKPLSASDLPAEIIESIVKQMEQAEPLTNLSIALTCPACEHHWDVLFDIVSFLWSEISFWAARMMNEVHLLASVYGWREADILAMSAWRRQRYLELIGA